MKNKFDTSTLPLHKLPIGSKGKVLNCDTHFRGQKKFADMGIVPGAELLMEAHAPFGGLLRVKVMESSISFHTEEAQNILLEIKGVHNEKTL